MVQKEYQFAQRLPEHQAHFAHSGLHETACIRHYTNEHQPLYGFAARVLSSDESSGSGLWLSI